MRGDGKNDSNERKSLRMQRLRRGKTRIRRRRGLWERIVSNGRGKGLPGRIRLRWVCPEGRKSAGKPSYYKDSIDREVWERKKNSRVKKKKKKKETIFKRDQSKISGG